MDQLVLTLEPLAQSLACRLAWGGEEARGEISPLLPQPPVEASLAWLLADPWAELGHEKSRRFLDHLAGFAAQGRALGRALTATPEMAELLTRALAAGPPLLVIRAAAPALMGLAWEYLANEEGSPLFGGLAGVVRQGLTDLPAPAGQPPARPLAALWALARPAEPAGTADGLAALALEDLGAPGARALRAGSLAALRAELGRKPGAVDVLHLAAPLAAGALVLEDGPCPAADLAEVLAGSRVPVLVLHGVGSPPADTLALAQELILAGVPAVLALARPWRPESRRQFLTTFQQLLATGSPVSAACQAARRELWLKRSRRRLVDWGAAALFLAGDPVLVRPDGAAAPARVEPAASLPPGREDEVLALDRRLAEKGAVLVQGPAGLGKSELLAGVAAWQARVRPGLRVWRGAGEADSAALVASLETELGNLPPAGPEEDLAARLTRLAQALREDPTPRLLLWDQVEALTGYPRPGSAAAEELPAWREFLAGLAGGAAEAVLASRRPEMDLSPAPAWDLCGLSLPAARRWVLDLARERGLAARLGNEVAEPGGEETLSRLVAQTGGHPLALAALAGRLGEAPLAALAEETPPVPPALAALLADLAPALEPADLAALELLGLAWGTCHAKLLVDLATHPDFPAGTGPRPAAATVQAGLDLARDLGLAVPLAADPEFWAPVPGLTAWAWGRLAARAAGGEAALKAHLIRGWAAFADHALHSLDEGDTAARALVVVGRQEEDLRRALAWAGAARAWARVHVILELLSVLWGRTGRGAEARAVRLAWRSLVTTADGGPVDAQDIAALNLWGVLWEEEAQALLSRGQAGEARDIYLRLQAPLDPDDPDQTLRRAANLHNLGVAEEHLGLVDEAVSHFRQSLELKEKLGNPAFTAPTLVHLGNLALQRGAAPEAGAWYGQAAEAFKLAGDDERLASLEFQLGMLAHGQNRLAEAEDHYRRSQDLRRAQNDQAGEAACLHQLGGVAFSAGDAVRAGERFQQALALAELAGDQARMGEYAHHLGLAADALGQAEQAKAWFERALGWNRAAGHQAGEALDLAQLGNQALQQEDFHRAEGLFRQALELHRAMQAGVWVARDLHQLGLVRLALDDLSGAEKHLEESLDFASQGGNAVEQAGTLTALGLVKAGQGHGEPFLAHVLAALNFYLSREELHPRAGEILAQMVHFREQGLFGPELLTAVYQKIFQEEPPDWLLERVLGGPRGEGGRA